MVVVTYGHFRKLTDSILCERLHRSSPFNSTQYAELYPQNGDRIVSIVSVTSLSPCVLQQAIGVREQIFRTNSLPFQ